MSTRIKKLILVGLMSIGMICLSGCDDPDTLIDNFSSELEHRIAMNQDQVDRLKNAGLLSEEAAASVKKAIEKQANDLKSLDKNKLSKVAVRVEGDAMGLTANNTDGDGDGVPDSALTVISEDNDAMKQLETQLDLKIYVIKKDPLGTGAGENALATLDIISKEVEKAKNGEASNIDAYFEYSGKKVWDKTLDENKLIKTTEDNPNHGQTSNVLGLHFIGVKTEADAQGNSKVVREIEVPLLEFNVKAIDRLLGKDGVNKDMYVVVDDKCYLMEYPVYCVSGFQATNNEYTATYMKSEIKVNMLTQELMGADGSTCVAPAGAILKVIGTGGYSELGEASFVVDGIKGEPPEVGYDDTTTTANADNFGRVVLRDYLELNYMPSVVEGENLVALGRRVRLTKFKGTGEEEIGLFIDKAGNMIENSVKIKSTDIMDINAGYGGKRQKLSLEVNQSATPTPTSSPSNVDTTSVFEVGQSQSALLEDEFVNQIEATTQFPGALVATTDSKLLGTLATNPNTSSTIKGKELKHLMYGIAVDIDPFQSNLFSGWIDITGENGDIGSLDWWNNWLATSTYNYNIDRDKLLAFLTGSYTYEMRDNNMILIDLKTVANIQREYNKESKISVVRTIQTSFVILGIILMGYAIVLIAAWVYDVNIIAGPRLLGIVSFRRWTAISDTDDIPYVNSKKKHYMTLGKICKSALIIVAIGAALIFIDIINIVDALISTFGAFAEIISKIINGVNIEK